MRMANPNPSPENQFKPGKSGNPSGKSSKQLKAEHKASKIAANLMLKSLSSLQESIESGEVDAKDLINADVLRFIKEAQDRAHGTPKTSIDHTSDGKPVPFAALALAPLEVDDADD